VAERLTGIQVQEEASRRPNRLRAPRLAVTAFIGRALRGPAQPPRDAAQLSPITSGSLAASGSRARCPTRSSSTSRAVGRRPSCCAWRTTPGPARLTSRRDRYRLTRLCALHPGTREYLRAAVDYDGIGDNEDGPLQPGRAAGADAPGSEHIEDQEIYRRLSVDPVPPATSAAALAASQLVTAAGPVPPVRPDRRDLRPGRAGLAGYVNCPTPTATTAAR
jgi:hypothetical protein